jgi:membrane associated rhomboid family serine protease
MKFSFNAPVVLIYTIVSCIVMLLSDHLLPNLNANYFAATGHFDWTYLPDYFRMVSHAIGHQDWNHLISNFSFILLIGPILEEKYGSKNLLLMMLVTAIVTATFNNILWDTGVMGASGIVFMMILLGSLVNLRTGTIPLTFVAILLLYLGGEIYSALTVEDNISQSAHIVGGVCGMFFGFLLNSKK